MTVHLLVLGLIGAISGLLAVVAGTRIEPFYSLLLRSIPSVNIQFVPRLKTLYSTRGAIENNRTVRIRDGYKRELQAAHQILVEERDYDERYYPVELSFTHNSTQLEFAGGRSATFRDLPKDDFISLIDSHISKIIGRIAAYAAVISIFAFVVLIILAAI